MRKGKGKMRRSAVHKLTTSGNKVDDQNEYKQHETKMGSGCGGVRTDLVRPTDLCQIYLVLFGEISLVSQLYICGQI